MLFEKEIRSMNVLVFLVSGSKLYVWIAAFAAPLMLGWGFKLTEERV